jgi:DHA1 family inner membrane transport protein
MLGILALLAAVEVALSVVATRPLATGIVVFFWGVATFATVPGLQVHVISRAQRAPVLASTLNIGAFNLGNAGGAWFGAKLLTKHVALRELPLSSAGWAVAAACVAAVSLAYERRGARPRESSTTVPLGT